MKEYYDETISKLESDINELKTELSNPIQLSEVAVKLVLESLSKIKQIVLKKGFKNTEEEIYFFKRLKPHILSKLIYYNAIYKIETRKPYGGKKLIKKYLNDELTKLKRYFDNNLEFYKYYRTNSSYLDHKYFIRGKYDIKLSLDTYYFETDHNFSTSHDYKVAKIIAHDLIQLYIEDQLYNVKKQLLMKYSSSNIFNWTANKTDLVELIYALHSSGSVNGGTAEIKEMALFCERILNIDLGDYYHTFLEIRSRKNNQTKFIDTLKESLLKKMEDLDE